MTTDNSFHTALSAATVLIRRLGAASRMEFYARIREIAAERSAMASDDAEREAARRQALEVERGIRLFETDIRARRISLAPTRPTPAAEPATIFPFEGPVIDPEPVPRDLLSGLAAHLTRIEALAWRTARLTAAGGPLSYLWLLIEPTIPIGFLILIYTLLGRGAVMDMPIAAFVVLGVGSWFLFRAVFLRLSAGLGSEVQLRRLPRITEFDAYAGRACFFVMLYLLIVIAALSALIWFGMAPPPDQPLLVAALMAWMAVAGFFNGVSFGYLALKFPPVAKIKGILVRIVYITSGAMYVTEQFPEEIKFFLLINPFLHCVQKIRDAYFSSYSTSDTSLLYMAFYLFVSVLVGAACLRAAARLPRAV